MKIQKKHWLYFAIAAAPVLSFLTVVLRCVALFTEYEQGRGYFDSDAPVNMTVTILMAVGFLLFLVLGIVLRRELSTPSYAGTLSIFFSAGFSAVSLAVFAVFTVIAFTKAAGFIGILMLLSALLALASAVYFAFFLFPAPPETTARGMLGLSFVFFCLLSSFILYFDMSEQMNSPAKLLSLLTFTVLTCYALGECRGLLGRQSPALQYLLTALGMVLSLTAAVPNILYTVTRGKELVLSTVYDFVLLAFGLYLFARLLQMLPRSLPVTHPLLRVFLRDDEDDDEAVEETDESEDDDEAEEEDGDTEDEENET